MGFEYVANHIPKNTPYNRRPAYHMDAETITIHTTANPSSNALGERGWLTNPSNNRIASYHIVIDEYRAVECIPVNETAWHAGDGNGDGNMKSIGIELCESGDYQKTLENAVELVSNMLKERGWGNGSIKATFRLEWKDSCPRMMYNGGSWKGWHEFVQRVESKLNKQDTYEYNKIYKEREHDTNVYYAKFKTGEAKFMFVYKQNAKVSELVRDYKASYGFNAPFFYNGKLLGDVEINDEKLFDTYGKMTKWHEFAVVDGKPKIAQIDINDSQNFVIQSAPLLVEGKDNPVHLFYSKHQEVNPDIANSRCQRTFIWIDDNEDLNVAVTDGRTSSNKGFTLGNAANYAIKKGAVMALNLDGGGSSIICDDKGGVNQPENTGKNERVTHHAVLVFVDGDNQYKDQRTIDVELDGRFVTRGLLVNGSTYLPLRLLGDRLNVPVRWNAQEKIPYANNKPIDNFILYEGRSYVGIRDSKDILDVDVRYDSARKVAQIITK